MYKLVVFDLDFTLWNAGGTWCDHTTPPFRKKHEYVEDSLGRKITLYPEVLNILDDLQSNNVPMAVASRTNEPSWAKELLKLFSIDDYFTYREIYPGCKVNHFNQLKKASNILFENMIFFDDEMRNIYEVGALGVKAVFVENGLNWELLPQV